MKALIQAEAIETNLVEGKWSVPHVNEIAGRCLYQCTRLDFVVFRF